MFALSYLPAWLVKSEGTRRKFGWVIKHVLVPESVLYPVIPSTGLAAMDFCDITVYSPLVWSEPPSLVCSLLVQVHCAWRCECQTCLKSIPTPPSSSPSNQRLWLTVAPGDLWSINNDKSPGGTRGFPFLLQLSIPHTHTRYSDVLFRKARCREEGVCMWGCCPFSEATFRKAVRFFENSSYPLSPVPHRRKATGNVCQRTREDAIYSPLHLVQNEGGKHWERKRGAAGSKTLGLVQKWTGERAREEGGGSWRRKNEGEGT